MAVKEKHWEDDDGRTIAWMWQDSVDMMNRRIYVLERD